MKHYCSLFFLLFSSHLFAQTKEEAALLSLHERKFKWLAEKQMDSLALLLDDRLQYIHSNGWVESRQEVFDDLTSGKLNYTRVDVKEAKARIYVDSGIVNGKGIFSVILDGKPIEINLLYTEVYIREKKQWRLVSRHACKI